MFDLFFHSVSVRGKICCWRRSVIDGSAKQLRADLHASFSCHWLSLSAGRNTALLSRFALSDPTLLSLKISLTFNFILVIDRQHTQQPTRRRQPHIQPPPKHHQPCPRISKQTKRNNILTTFTSKPRRSPTRRKSWTSWSTLATISTAKCSMPTFCPFAKPNP